jgi:Ca2+-binding EF-hand superfamily protein
MKGGMLVAMELVDKEVIDQLLHRFAELDADGSGRLDADDLRKVSSIGRRSSFKGRDELSALTSSSK